MPNSPTRKPLGSKAHIKKEWVETINSSLDFLERDGGEALNYVIEKGILALGLPLKKNISREILSPKIRKVV